MTSLTISYSISLQVAGVKNTTMDSGVLNMNNVGNATGNWRICILLR